MKKIFKIISIILLFVTYYCVISPISCFVKILQIDILKISINKNVNSYWIIRKSLFKNKSFFSQWL